MDYEEIDYGTIVDANKLYIDKSLREIPDYAFYNKPELLKYVTDVYFPKKLEKIGEWAFYECPSLNHLHFHEDSIPEEIGEKAFKGCEYLREALLPWSIQSIGEEAFSECESLECVVIPNEIRNIAAWAFYYCTNLKRVFVPELYPWAGTEIEKNIFEGCENLESVYWFGKETKFLEEIEWPSQNITLYVRPQVWEKATKVLQPYFERIAVLSEEAIKFADEYGYHYF